MSQEKPYIVIAYYHIAPIEKPEAEVLFQKSFLHNRDITSRIYISEQGINAQMSALRKDAEEYMEWMRSRFEGIWFKLQDYHEHVFPKKIVKYRKHLVGYNDEVDFSKQGVYLDPVKWKEMLENAGQKILIDVRNDYEWKVRHVNPYWCPTRKFKQRVMRQFGGHLVTMCGTLDSNWCRDCRNCETYYWQAVKRIKETELWKK